MQSDDLILGIDGGATKTVAWLAVRSSAESPEVIGRGTAGGSNPQSVGFATAAENLLSGDTHWHAEQDVFQHHLVLVHTPRALLVARLKQIPDGHVHVDYARGGHAATYAPRIVGDEPVALAAGKDTCD